MNALKTELLDAHMISNSPTPQPPPKSWGWVSCRPSEYLVVFRRGAVAERLCRQGGRFWKWPSDSYAIVPTTLKEVVFHSNQITTDLVEVRVRGMVVFRIKDPLRIYALINFMDRQAGEAKLAQMISDICRSIVKRLVANLRLEECMRRRKEEITEALMREVATVASDSWGVEIVALDVQDVFVQDEEMYQAMQAGFRAEKHREAELARLDAARAIEGRRLEGERALEKERQELALTKAQRDSEVELTRLELARRREEQADANAKQKQEREAERARLAAEAELTRARIAAEARRVDADEATRALRERLAVESSAGKASLDRLFLTETAPQMAKLVAASLTNAKVNLYQGGGIVPLVLSEVLDAVKTRGDGAA